MIAPIQGIQCVYNMSLTILANLEPPAPNTHQSKLVPIKLVLLIATNVKDPHLGHE